MIGDLHAPWRDEAACADEDPRLWDSTVVGETWRAREHRTDQAVTICRRCPVAEACWNDVDWARDRGIRAGRMLPDFIGLYRPIKQRPAGWAA